MRKMKVDKGSNEQKDHKFWNTQPVPAIGQSPAFMRELSLLDPFFGTYVHV